MSYRYKKPVLDEYDYLEYYPLSRRGYAAYYDTDPYKHYSNDRSSFVASSGYGHDDCCPLVVDPLTLVAILGAIAAATFFLNTAITMNIPPPRRRKRDDEFGVVKSQYGYVVRMFWIGKKI